MVTRKGFVWDTEARANPNNTSPELSDYSNVEDVGTLSNGTFQDTISGLSPSTTYYYRAFGYDDVEDFYAYGDEVSFTTKARTLTEGDEIYFSKISKFDDKSINECIIEVAPNQDISMGEEIQVNNPSGVKRFRGYVREIDIKNVKKVSIKSPMVVLADRTLNKIYRDEAPEDIVADVFTELAPDITFTSEVTTGVTMDKTYKDKRGIDIVNELVQTFNGYLEEDLDFNVTLKTIGSETSNQSITEGIERLSGGVRKHSDALYNKIIVVGKKVLNRTTESKTGTNTVFSVNRKPIDARVIVSGTELVQTIPGSIDGDYSIDIENKEFTFESSVTDPVIEYSYETQIKATATASKSVIDNDFGGKIKEKKIEVPYVESVEEAFDLALEYLEKYSTELITAPYQVKTYNPTLYEPNHLIAVFDEVRDIDRFLIIRKVERSLPGEMIITVGDELETIIDWQKETIKRVKQLEDKQDNSDLLNEFILVEEEMNLQFTTEITSLTRRTFAEDTFYLEDDSMGVRNQMKDDGTGPIMRDTGGYTDESL